MTLSVSAALEALHLARGHVADLVWLRAQWGPLAG